MYEAKKYNLHALIIESFLFLTKKSSSISYSIFDINYIELLNSNLIIISSINDNKWYFLFNLLTFYPI